VLFPERSTPERLLELIAKHRPTILVNVPTMVGKLLGAARQEDDLGCLRLSTSAGEALPVELFERWSARFGVPLLDGLGTAEMWHVFVSNRPGAVRPGTLGQVVPGFELRVCDDEGRELPDGEIGWLWVKGGSRAIAYWQLQEASERAFRGPWYVSGDMIRRDADGYVTYCGRGDDMLKVAGKWLAPAEVEGCLSGHPAVAACAVVGVVDEAGLTKPYAFVVLRPGAPPPEAGELEAFVRERLDPYKVPRKLLVYDKLPETHLGKVDRGALRRAVGSSSPETSSS
jgi:acyl-coenzyme A synthetase/AMP-(fatty) acid ligase